MTILSSVFGSSVGKKFIVGITGLAICLFVLMHFLGNLNLLIGKEAFLDYAKNLHALPGFVAIELLFASAFLVHIAMTIKLIFENKAARPVDYAVKKSAGVKTLGSATTMITGIYLLLFLVFHLLNIKFAIIPSIDTIPTAIAGVTPNVYEVISYSFKNLGLVLFYIGGAVCVGIHISHGFQSSFQSLGLNSPKYMPLLRTISNLFGVLVAIGYTVISVFMFIVANMKGATL
ncbi:MAG: succinate dehydrogenase cytochrome b subunit [Candidatus Kapabacteria bacterium]|nr:succinate dehydrogenase cytochrome b subunit [Candidatus Kapabacteria bacterium]